MKVLGASGKLFGGILRAFWWQLISFLQPCTAKMAPKRPRKAKKLLIIAIFLILGALGGCLGPILEGLGGVLEALGGVLEACGSVLEALGGVLEALEGVLKASWRLLKSSWRPRWVKIALESENIEKHKEKQGFWASCRGCLGRLGGSWEGLEGVLEAS